MLTSPILQTASHWAESFDALLNAYEQIGEQIPQLEQYKAIFDYSPRMRQVLAFIYEDILDFHKRAIRFFPDRGICRGSSHKSDLLTTHSYSLASSVPFSMERFRNPL
jgi:hypothetical protein